jgi:hypothetical protein
MDKNNRPASSGYERGPRDDHRYQGRSNLPYDCVRNVTPDALEE